MEKCLDLALRTAGAAGSVAPTRHGLRLERLTLKLNIMRLNIQLITAAILSLGGLVMLFCGVFIDPEGQIHESLLVGFGEVATFAGALMGVDYIYRRKN